MSYANVIPRTRGADPRRSRRRAAGWLAQLETHSGMTIGRTDNLSTSGLLLRTPETFPPGTEAIVRFHLPPQAAGPLIESLVEVVRSEPGSSMGMRFLDLCASDRARLAEYVRQGEVN